MLTADLPFAVTFKNLIEEREEEVSKGNCDSGRE